MPGAPPPPLTSAPVNFSTILVTASLIDLMMVLRTRRAVTVNHTITTIEITVTTIRASPLVARNVSPTAAPTPPSLFSNSDSGASTICGSASRRFCMST